MRRGPRAGASRTRLAILAVCLAALAVIGSARAKDRVRHQTPKADAAGLSPTGKRARIDRLIRTGIRAHDLHAVIVQVTVAGGPLITKAYGTSMTGVPATVDMHFRNGGVAISYMSTLLLRLVDQKKVKLGDPISRWLPGLRGARRVTLGMLAQMSAGYHDYELDPRLNDQLDADPFRQITTKEQLALALSAPQQFKPGTNWSYSHSDYVILGLVLEKITRQPLGMALRKQVLRPLGLTNTVGSNTPEIPAPVLHAYTSERREFLGINPLIPFLEDSTYWNPSWTLAHGAIETTDIADMTRTAIGIGTGRLLTRRSYQLQINPHLGFGRPQPGCERCQTLNRALGYGLGVFRSGAWILYNPSFGGYGAIEAYLPAKRISIAIVTTFREGSFDAEGNPTNWSQILWAQIATFLAPRYAPPVP